MSVILILILASLTVALVFLGAFIWSVRSGQYDDTTTPALRMLTDDGTLPQSPQTNTDHATSTVHGPSDSPAGALEVRGSMSDVECSLTPPT